MIRIEGVNLPLKKRIEYGLTYIHGLGVVSSRDILNKLKISLDKRVKDLTDHEVVAIQRAITATYTVEGELRKEVTMNIKRLQEAGAYRGLRHKRGLPTRGQRTKTNARTRKGPKKSPVAMKKKVTKK